jgi:hypothetical protein
MHRRLVVWVTLTAALAAAPALLAAPPAHANWSAPAQLRGCASALSGAPPLVVFPSSAPSVRSGPGMVLWEGGAAGGGTGGVGVAALRVWAAPIAADGLPGAGGALRGVDSGLVIAAAAVGTTAGQVLVAGAADLSPAGSALSTAAGDGVSGTAHRPSAAGGRTAGGADSPTAPGPADAGAYVEGRGPGAFSAPRALGGPPSPVAAYTGYLGDAVLASTVRAPHAGGWAIAIRVQRHYAATPNRTWRLPVGGRPSAVAVTMDYRSDVLAVWDLRGRLYAREITQGGLVEPLTLLAQAGGVAELRALFSDDGRAIVAWRAQAFPANAIRARARVRAREWSAERRVAIPSARAASAAFIGGTPDVAAAQSTTIALDVSGPDLSFGRPTLVERFADVPGLPPPPGSLRLTRMSSEAVMAAWTGRPRGGRYVVRASPVSLRRGAWAPVTVSGASAGREALLAELVPGPRAEVLALWVAAPRLPDGALAARRRAIVAAWGHYGGRGEARFAAPETIAPPGPNGRPAAAFDPDNDGALAAWATGVGTATPQIVYAQRTAGPPTPPQRLAVAVPGSTPIAQRTPHAGARAPGAARDPRATHAQRRTGVSPAWAGVGLLLFAAAAACREIGRRRGWVGMRRA